MAEAFLDVVLKLVGGFYALGCVFGLRRMAMDFLLTQAIGAIGTPNPLEARAEKERNLALTASLLLVGIGGVVLLADLELAAWIFFASLILYAGYLFILAPLRLDPHDPPEEPGRGQTKNAFWIYLAATALVGVAWWQGQLTPLDSASPIALAFAATTAIGLIGYTVKLRLQARLTGPAWPGMQALPDDDDDRPVVNDADYERRLEEDIAEIRAHPLVMRPSWNRGAFFNPETGQPVYMPEFEGFTFADNDAITRWLTLHHELADRDDPYRCRLGAPDALAKLEEAGRPLFEKLSQTLGHDRFTFDPQPASQPAERTAERIKLMPDGTGPSLWIMGDDIYEPIEPDEFGVSQQLAVDISYWELAYLRSYDQDDPGGEPFWTEAEYLEHEEQGRKLAIRLARELAATGRAHVEVNAYRRSDGIYPIKATDPI